MKKEKIKKKYHIKIHIKFIFLLILILLFSTLSILSLLKGLSSVTVYQFFYTENSNIDYTTCLKENEYFTERCLEKNKQYIASIIDYIEAELKYTFHSSSIFDYKYTYSVTANILANEKGDLNKILYNKEETIKEAQEIIMNDSNSFTIKETLHIDYNKYNNIMKNFKKDYTLLMDCRLIITMNIQLTGNYNNMEEITSYQNITLTMPLSEQTINVSMDYKDIDNSEVINKGSKKGLINILFYTLSSLCFIIDLFLIIRLIFLLKKVNKSKSVYAQKLKKIMKQYNQIIVETKNTLILDNTHIIDVDNFEELLDAREAIGKPILYTKIDDKTSQFIIVSGNDIYRYMLNSNDLDK